MHVSAKNFRSSAQTIKSAPHRGRASLEQTNSNRGSTSRARSKDLLDWFVAAFNAQDVDGITDVLLENVYARCAGSGHRTRQGMVFGIVFVADGAFPSYPTLIKVRTRRCAGVILVLASCCLRGYSWIMDTQSVVIGEIVLDSESVTLRAEVTGKLPAARIALLKYKLAYILDTRFRPLPTEPAAEMTLDEVTAL